MHVVELAFQNDSRRLDARPAHRKRLTELHAAGQLVMAGPLAGDTGALLVFDVDGDEAMREVMDADPYYRTPGVTVASVRRWEPIVP